MKGEILEDWYKVLEDCKTSCCNFLLVVNYTVIYISKSKGWPSLKFLQTFKRIGDGAWLCVSVLSLAR